MEDQELLVQQADGYSCLCRRTGARTRLQGGFRVKVTSYQVFRSSDPGPVSATGYSFSILSICGYFISHNRSGYPVNTKCEIFSLFLPTYLPSQTHQFPHLSHLIPNFSNTLLSSFLDILSVPKKEFNFGDCAYVSKATNPPFSSPKTAPLQRCSSAVFTPRNALS